MDDPPQQLRTGPEWNRSEACAEPNVIACGAIALDEDEEAINVLNDLATEISAFFGLHRTVREMRVANIILATR